MHLLPWLTCCPLHATRKQTCTHMVTQHEPGCLHGSQCQSVGQWQRAMHQITFWMFYSQARNSLHSPFQVDNELLMRSHSAELQKARNPCSTTITLSREMPWPRPVATSLSTTATPYCIASRQGYSGCPQPPGVAMFDYAVAQVLHTPTWRKAT